MKKILPFIMSLFSAFSYAQLAPPYPSGSTYSKGMVISQAGFGVPGCTNLQSIAADGSGCSGSSTFNPTSQQSTTNSPTVYDFFRKPDNTAISGATAESNNASWFVTGSNVSNAVVSNTFLINNGGAASNWYAFLPNSVNGGTQQNIVNSITVFKFCSPVSGTLDPTMYNGTMILADTNGDLNTMVHLNFGPLGWSLTKRLSGGSFIGILSGTMNAIVDCNALYSFKMNVNVASGTIVVTDPFGHISSVTDPDITTIAPKAIAVQTNENVNGADVQWGYVGLGGPQQSGKYDAAGNAANASDLAQLQGVNNSAKNQYTITIPTAGGGGGNGWYTIANQTSLVGFLITGDFLVTASDGIAQQFFSVHTWTEQSTSAPIITQTFDNHVNAVIDQVRLSNDGSTHVKFEVHLTSLADTYGATITVQSTGIMLIPTTFAVGSTPYTNVSTLAISAGIFQQQTLAGISDWYTIMTASSNCGGFCITGNFQFTAVSSPGLTPQVFLVSISASTSACNVYQLSNTGTTQIDQVRCSWDATHIQVDFHKTQGNTYTVTLTSVISGLFIYNPLPVSGATVLSGGNNSHYLWSGLSNPVAVSASIGGSALAAGACATASTAVNGSFAGAVGEASATDGTVQANYVVSAVGNGTNTAIVSVCAITAGTPASKTYNVRMFQ